jgi:hypothetical protein
MDDSPDEAVPAAGAAAASPPDANRLDIRARGADAMLGRIYSQKPEAGSVRRLPPLFVRLFSYGPHAALAACLFGFVWVAASYFSGGQLPFYVMKPGLVRTVVPQESVERAEMLRTAQKMAEDIRLLKASVEAMHTTQSSVIAELAGKVEHMQRDSAAQLSHFIERFDRMEHQIAAVAAAPHGADSVLKAAIARKQARGGRGDAFDPSQNPTAPGAPRPLGSHAPAATNATGENASGQRNN